jgi:hypothetical protein
MGTAYLPFPIAKFAYKFFKTFLPTSEYMFFLDVSPDEALRRIQKKPSLLHKKDGILSTQIDPSKRLLPRSPEFRGSAKAPLKLMSPFKGLGICRCF